MPPDPGTPRPAHRILDLGLTLTVGLLLGAALAPFLSAQHLAGWDTSSHLYLFTRLLEALGRGRLHFYDPLWYAGYPAFVLYPPLAYLLLAIPKALTFGALSATHSFTVSVAILPFLLLASFVRAGRRIFGVSERWPFIFFGALFLFLPPAYAHMSVGLAALVQIGFIPAMIGMCLYLEFLGSLSALEGRRGTLRPALLLAAMVLAHSLTAAFALWTLAGYVAFRRTRATAGGAVLALLYAGFVTAWWWIPFLRAAGFSSATPIGLVQSHPDPLLVIFPGVFSGEFYWQLRHALASWSAGRGTHFEEAARLLPLAGFSMLIFWVAGMRRLLREERFFLPVFFVLSLLLLPREYLSRLISAPIHYYRFTAPLMWCALLIASYGLGRWAERFGSARRKAAIVTLLALVLLHEFGFQFALRRATLASRPLTVRFHPDTGAYPDARAAAEISERLARLKPDGRIYEEDPENNFARLGSPHYFSAELPARYRLPMANGLLVESSLSAGFLNPAAFRFSNHLRWGRETLWLTDELARQPIEAFLDRLELYHVRYVLASGRRFRTALRRAVPSRLTEEAVSGRFTLFRLRQTRPFLEQTSLHPYLFVNGGGIDFRRFAEGWYLSPRLFEAPVISAPDGTVDVPPEDLAAIGGIVLSWPQGARFSDADWQPWEALGKPIIVLNATPRLQGPLPDRLRFINEFPSRFGVRQLERLMSPAEPAIRHAVTPAEVGDEQVRFEAHGGVLVNYSYATGWRSETPGTRLYLATPSLMFVFAHGSATLRYR